MPSVVIHTGLYDIGIYCSMVLCIVLHCDSKEGASAPLSSHLLVTRQSFVVTRLLSSFCSSFFYLKEQFRRISRILYSRIDCKAFYKTSHPTLLQLISDDVFEVERLGWKSISIVQPNQNDKYKLSFVMLNLQYCNQCPIDSH